MRVLVVTSVVAERDAVVRGIRGSTQFEVIIGGVGQAAAAASTAASLATGDYDLVVCAGIGGGFAERAAIGALVVSNQIIAADLGAETTEGFIALNELGFGSVHVSVDTNLLNDVVEALQTAGLSVTAGPVLTVSTVTGSAQTCSELTTRIPGAAAEAMEGFGVATAARNCNVPILEIRAISNLVGPRDRGAWRIQEALQALEAASTVLAEVLK